MDAQGLQRLLENNREKIIVAVDQAERARHEEQIQRRGVECARTYDRIFKAFQTFADCIGGNERLDSTRTFGISLEDGDYIDFGKGSIWAEVVGVNPPYQETPIKNSRGFAVEYYFIEDAIGETAAKVLLGNETFQAFDRSDDGLTPDSLVLESLREWTEHTVLDAETKVESMKALAYQTLSLLTDRANDTELNPQFDDNLGKEYLEPLRPSV